MKLQKLIISNFRGLKGDKNIIDFTNSDIIFLIGQNNVGKSSVLRAYEFFTNSKQQASKEDFCNYDINTPIIIEGVFKKETSDDADVDLNPKNKEPEWVKKWVDEDGLIKIRKQWCGIGAFKKETFAPDTNSWIANGFGGMDTLFTKYSPKAISIGAMEDESTLGEKVNKLIQDDFIKTVKEQYSEQFSEIVIKIQELQSEITGCDAVAQLNQDLNSNFQKVFADLTLKIDPAKEENIKLEDSFKKNHSISVVKNGIDRKETFDQYGHGVIRQALFNFISFLKREHTSQKQYIILFEEPELFLHPSATIKLRSSLYELIENSPYQILCATHSPMMIDISKPHSSLLRLTKDENQDTHTFQVGESVFNKDAEMKEWVQMVNRFNPHICEAFYADKVLLVEGDTEAIVYRDLLNRFYPDEEIFVLNTGSKTNIPFFQIILTEFNIEHYIIHDSDSRLTAKGANNPAWSLNSSIWTLTQNANNKQSSLARRYIHIKNFEEAHQIILSGGKDKPLRAYQFAKSIDINSDVCCLTWLKDIIGDKSILHDDTYVNNNVK